MKIILGVDDSVHSDAAVNWVKKMTWPRDTKIVVISAARPPVGAYAEVYVPQPSFHEQVLEQEIRMHQELSSKVERTLQSAGFSTEARVAEGDPRIALLEAARRERADLIVVGSHGRSGIAKLLIGSVASHVVTHAPCSVVVVKTGENGSRADA